MWFIARAVETNIFGGKTSGVNLTYPILLTYATDSQPLVQNPYRRVHENWFLSTPRYRYVLEIALGYTPLSMCNVGSAALKYTYLSVIKTSCPSPRHRCENRSIFGSLDVYRSHFISPHGVFSLNLLLNSFFTRSPSARLSHFTSCRSLLKCKINLVALYRRNTAYLHFAHGVCGENLSADTLVIKGVVYHR